MNGYELLGFLDRAGFAAVRVLVAGLWQSSILFAAAGAILWALRKRRAYARHAILVGALVVAPLLPLISSGVSRSGAPQKPVRVLPSYGERERYAAPAARGIRVETSHEIRGTTPVSTAIEPAEEIDFAEEVRVSPLDYPWALAFVGYCFGFALFVGWMVLGKLRIRKWIRDATPVWDERVMARFREVKEYLRVRRDVLVLESADAPVPMTAGFLWSVVLLPRGIAALNDEDLRAIAIHETAHVRRRDPLVLGLVSLVRAAFFFHPLVWLAARRVSALAEEAADEAVLEATGEPVRYAKMLARFAEGLPRTAMSTEVAAGIVLSRSAFLRRIRMILSERRGRMRRLSRMALAATVVAGIGSIVLAAALPLKEKATEEDSFEGAGGSRAGMKYSPEEVAALHRAEQGVDLPLHELAKLYAKEAIDLAQTAVEEGWGEAVEGVQVSLRADRVVWKAGEIPTLSVDVRNLGPHEMRIAPTQETCEVEVDGKWYTWHGVRGYRPKAVPKGGKVGDIVVSLFDIWREKSDQSRGSDMWHGTRHDAPLTLSPGTHTIRVACQPQYRKSELMSHVVRAVSNPVEIQILPGTARVAADEWGEAVEGVRSRLRAERPVWRSGDVPILRADAENGGNRNLMLTPVQEFFEVEVDGSWYKWAEPVELEMPVPPFSPGREIIGIGISLDNRWGLKGTDKRLDLTLGEHVIRVAVTCRPRAPDTGGLVRVLSNPARITILAANEAPDGMAGAWGEGVEGVECGLAAERLVWYVGETPHLNAAVRNSGTQGFYIHRAQELLALEFDGEWYQWSLAEMGWKASVVEPGEGYGDIFVSLAEQWQPPADSTAHLNLGPGKHTVRVALKAGPMSGSGGQAARVISNPVEVEIVRGSDEALIGSLHETLASRQVDARLLALEDLSNLASEAAVSAVIVALKDQEGRVRASAARVLGGTKSNEAFRELTIAVGDRDDSVRAASAEALGEMDRKAAIAVLRGLLEDSKDRVRMHAASALVRLGEPFPREAVVSLIVSKEREWQNAIWVVRRQAGKDAAQILASCLETDDPSTDNYYNYTLVWQIGACGGPRLTYHHDFDGRSTAEQVEENRRTLEALKALNALGVEKEGVRSEVGPEAESTTGRQMRGGRRVGGAYNSGEVVG